VNAARLIALDVLCQVENGAFASDLLDERLAGLDSRDAGLATEIVLGSLRRRPQVDALIERAARRAVNSMEPEVRNALRLGVYQLKFLSRIPAHAAVGESVESVRAAGKGHAASFVNAVLRHVPSPPVRYPDAETRLCLPTWLWDSWRRSYGAKDAEAAALAALCPPEPWYRLPPGVAPPEWAVAGPVEGSWLIRGEAPPGARRQDIGSQAVVGLLDLRPGQTVLDLCAAPGNKTLQILEAKPKVVAAADSSGARLAAMPPVCPRVRLDAETPLPFQAAFDRILVDAPCSGTGTLARNPEIKWRLAPADIAAHAARQREILANALEALKPGGRLVYATCSLESRENEEVVLAVAPGRVVMTTTRLPGREPGDGFFAAVLS
jgi:16S rRNA (cytosine967-C5)-methyltransferase